MPKSSLWADPVDAGIETVDEAQRLAARLQATFAPLGMRPSLWLDSKLKITYDPEVLAADTKTGKDQPEAVTAVLVRRDTDLYNLTVTTSTGTEVIHTTAGHLFWEC